MHMLARRHELVALAAALLSGCWVPVQTGEKIQADIRAWQSSMQHAQKGLDEQSARLEEQITRADTKITEVVTTLDELNTAARRTDADFGVQMERLIRDTQELRGQLELVEYRLKKMEAQLEGDGSLVQRMDQLESGKSKGGESSKSDALEVPSDPKAMLVFAQDLVQQKKVDDARGVYRDVIRRVPNSQGVTDQAYYRLAELYWGEKEYRRALQEYISVVEKFNKGEYVDDALYKIGLCSMELGHLEDAKLFFTEILNNHKKSPLVKAAKTKLSEVSARLERASKKKNNKK